MKSPTILLMSAIPEQYVARLQEKGQVIRLATPSDRAAVIKKSGADVDVVVTNGIVGLTAQEMDALQKLKLVCCLGVGYEGIDITYAKTKGIQVSYGPNTNTDTVADHAFALMLAVARNLRAHHHVAEHGIPRNSLPMPSQITGKKLGIFGLGTIGAAIARRAAGFDLEIGYHSRRPRESVNYRFFDGIESLATWCDFLVISAPGNPDTHKIVNADVLSALGCGGSLINISRASLIDEGALAHALKNGLISGAALDVYEGQPETPRKLAGFSNLLITPHVASRSHESMNNMVAMALENLDAYVSSKKLISPVP